MDSVSENVSENALRKVSEMFLRMFLRKFQKMFLMPGFPRYSGKPWAMSFEGGNAGGLGSFREEAYFF